MATTGLQRTLESEALAVERFVALLRDERQLLVEGQVDQIGDLLEEKNRLASQLAQLAEQRSRLLAIDGRTADRQSIAAWFAAHPAEAEASACWSRLLSLAGEARDLNQLNGELIRLRLQHNAEALRVLGAGVALDLYDRDGQSAPAAGSRIADRA